MHIYICIIPVIYIYMYIYIYIYIMPLLKFQADTAAISSLTNKTLNKQYHGISCII